MKDGRRPLLVALAVGAALLLQVTLFGRVRVAGIAPDLVVLVAILATLRLRNETALLVAFGAGLVFDALSATAVGLRALSYTLVVYVAIRTRDRADAGPFSVAVWVGLLTLLGAVLFLVIGTIFGQVGLEPEQAMRRLLVLPVLNTAVAMLLTPLVARLLEPDRRVW